MYTCVYVYMCMPVVVYWDVSYAIVVISADLIKDEVDCLHWYFIMTQSPQQFTATTTS